MDKTNNKGMAQTVVVLVVALVIGVAGAYALGNNNKSSDSPKNSSTAMVSSATNAADLRST